MKKNFRYEIFASDYDRKTCKEWILQLSKGHPEFKVYYLIPKKFLISMPWLINYYTTIAYFNKK